MKVATGSKLSNAYDDYRNYQNKLRIDEAFRNSMQNDGPKNSFFNRISSVVFDDCVQLGRILEEVSWNPKSRCSGSWPYQSSRVRRPQEGWCECLIVPLLFSHVRLECPVSPATSVSIWIIEGCNKQLATEDVDGVALRLTLIASSCLQANGAGPQGEAEDREGDEEAEEETPLAMGYVVNSISAASTPSYGFGKAGDAGKQELEGRVEGAGG
eukprot:768169-Hanusia_phi.AAC.1